MWLSSGDSIVNNMIMGQEVSMPGRVSQLSSAISVIQDCRKVCTPKSPEADTDSETAGPPTFATLDNRQDLNVGDTSLSNTT